MHLFTNVYAMSNYDRLRIVKALGNFPVSDNNNNKKSKNNVRRHFLPENVCIKNI